MLAPLPGPLSGYPLPHYCPDPTSFFGTSDESLHDFMALMVATDLTMQTPSECSGRISKAPTSSLHHDAGVYFHSPMLDAGHTTTSLDGRALDSDFSYDLRQCRSDVFRSDCAPLTSSQFSPPLDVSWPTNFPSLPSHEAASSTQVTPSHYQKSNILNPPSAFSSDEHSPTTDHIKPTCLFPHYPGAETYPVNRGRDSSYNWQRDPRAMRECLMLQADGTRLTETFRKSPKDVVASPNTRKASSTRRKHVARFKCPIDGCNGDFTRKHNLDNHLRSHCGITDLICDVCHLGFTTIPVWKRHKKTCRHPWFPRRSC